MITKKFAFFISLVVMGQLFSSDSGKEIVPGSIFAGRSVGSLVSSMFSRPSLVPQLSSSEQQVVPEYADHGVQVIIPREEKGIQCHGESDKYDLTAAGVAAQLLSGKKRVESRVVTQCRPELFGTRDLAQMFDVLNSDEKRSEYLGFYHTILGQFRSLRSRFTELQDKQQNNGLSTEEIQEEKAYIKKIEAQLGFGKKLKDAEQLAQQYVEQPVKIEAQTEVRERAHVLSKGVLESVERNQKELNLYFQQAKSDQAKQFSLLFGQYKRWIEGLEKSQALQKERLQDKQVCSVQTQSTQTMVKIAEQAVQASALLNEQDTQTTDFAEEKEIKELVFGELHPQVQGLEDQIAELGKENDLLRGEKRGLSQKCDELDKNLIAAQEIIKRLEQERLNQQVYPVEAEVFHQDIQGQDSDEDAWVVTPQEKYAQVRGELSKYDDESYERLEQRNQELWGRNNTLQEENERLSTLVENAQEDKKYTAELEKEVREKFERIQELVKELERLKETYSTTEDQK